MSYINPDHFIRHAAAYVLAFAIGTLTIAPYAYFAATIPEYAGITLMGQDAEEHYLARMQEAYEGRPGLGNVFTSFKEMPYLSPGLGEAAMAGAAWILALPVTSMNLAAKFFLPPIVFLLIYGFALEVSRSRAAALFGATAAMLGTAIMSNPYELLALMRAESLTAGITWARPINPQLSGALLFGGLWLLYRAYLRREQSSWMLVGSIGATIGLSLYLSVYAWSFLGLVLFLLFVLELVRKNYSFALKLLGAGLGALALALPFALNNLAATALPGYAAAAQFQGVLASHAPSFGIWILILFVLPWLAWRGHLSHSRAFFVVCGLALFVAFNQQIITGLYLQPGHYHWYITKPLVALMLAVAGAGLVRRYAGARTTAVACSASIAVLLAHGIFAQTGFYIKNAPEARQAQEYAPLFAYLNQNEEKSAYANPLLSNYIAIYTRDDAPGSWYAGLYFLTENYLKNRLFFEYRLRDTSNEMILPALQEERESVAMQLYGGHYWRLPGKIDPLPDSVLEALAQEYRAQEKRPLSALMKELGIILIVQDKLADRWDPAAAGLAPATTINGRFAIYRLP